MKLNTNSNATLDTDLLKCFQDSIIIPNQLSFVEWCKRNCYLPNPPYSISGFFDASQSPYMVGPMEALDDDTVREVVICGNPRGGKTLIAEAYLLFTLSESPADIWWAVHKEESIKAIMDVRFMPLFEANKRRIDFTDDRFQKTQRFIKFNVGSLKLVGAQNASGMVQTSGRVLIGDEVWQWKDGVLDQFRTRADDFPHSKKILLISQASDEDKDFHKAYMGGQQAEFGFKCPHCEFEQKYLFSYKFNDGTFGGLNWDRNDVTRPKGQWNIEEASKTAHYTCTNPACRHNFYDSARERRLLNDCGLYITTNPNAPAHIRSFKWNALATPNVSYIQLAKEYLQADYENERGKHEPIRNYWTQRMSHFFSIGRAQDQSQPMVGDTDSSGSLANGERVMGVDSQANGSHPYVVVGFDTVKKEMSVITYGTAVTFDEVEKVRVDNRVKVKRVLCDCRYQQSDNVFVEIAKKRVKGTLANGQPTIHSYIATVGVGNRKDNSWYHGKDKRTGVEINKPYSPAKHVPIKFGTNQMVKGFLCPVVSFANDPIKDVLKLLLENKHPEWKLIISEAAQKDAAFMAQINNEKKICKTDSKGYQKWIWQKQPGDNDYFDCLVLCTLYGHSLNYL